MKRRRLISMTRPCSKRMVKSKEFLETNLATREISALVKAVFLDRDGTINVHKGYITNPNDIELIPDVGNAVRELNLLGYLVVIVSNQSPIESGSLTKQQFEKINDALWGLLRQSNAYYDALYYCPHNLHHKPPCACRKPQPGLLLQAAFELMINLSESILVGDTDSDIQAGQIVGCKTILVLTGKREYNLCNNSNVSPDFIADTLSDAVSWIINCNYERKVL
jgi:mannose-1-phosphate guanylyltransferase / phosphomannomutase